jgi:hypothetical protein
MTRPDWANPTPELAAAVARWEARDPAARRAPAAAAAPQKLELLPGRLGAWWRLAMDPAPAPPARSSGRR